MAAKIVLIFCAQALLIQFAMSQKCTSPAAVAAAPGIPAAGPYGLAAPGMYNSLAAPGLYNGLAAPYGLAGASLTYNGLAAPFGAAYEGLAPFGIASPLAGAYGYNSLMAPALIETIPAFAPYGCSNAYGYLY